MRDLVSSKTLFTLLTSPSAERFRAACVTLRAVEETDLLVVRAFLGGAAGLSRAAALALVKRVLALFSSFSLVTALRIARTFRGMSAFVVMNG